MNSRLLLFVFTAIASTEIKEEVKELLKDSTVVNTLVDILDYKLNKKTEELQKKTAVEKAIGQKIVGNEWKEVNADSDESCATICTFYEKCVGYNYLNADKLCSLFDSVEKLQPEETVICGQIRRSFVLARIPASPNDTAPPSAADAYDLKMVKSAVAKHIHVCQKKFEFLTKKLKVTRDSLGGKIRSLEIDTSKAKCLKGGRPSACDNFAKRIEERNNDIYNAVLTYVEEQNAIKQLQEGMDTRLTEMGHFLATYQPVTVAEPAQDLIGSVLMQTKEMQNNVRIELESKIERNDAEMRRNQGAIRNLRAKIDNLPLVADQPSEIVMNKLDVRLNETIISCQASVDSIKSEFNLTKIDEDISAAHKLAQGAWNRARKVDNFSKRLNATIFSMQEMDFRSQTPDNQAPVRRDISNLRIEEMTEEIEGIIDRLTRLEGDLAETNSFVYDVLLDDLNKKVDELEKATGGRVEELDTQVTEFVSRSSRDMMKLHAYMKKTTESLEGKVIFSKKTFDKSMKDLISAAKANKEHFRRLEQKVNSHESSEHVIQIVAKDLTD